MRVLLFILLIVSSSLAEEVVKVSARDSYLDAYQESKPTTSKVSKEIKAEKKSDSGYPVYPGPIQQFGPSDSYASPQYGPPSSQYGPSAPQYGPPSPQYGPPAPQYGPAAPQYGPPAPQYDRPSPQYGLPPSYGTFAEPTPQYGPPIYGPPAQNLQVFYGVPHAMISIWDKLWEKLKFKLNVFTFGKILLKLVIFKKIVSLIAIVCLLLFIPSLKHKKESFFGDDGAERSLQTNTSDADESLNNLAGFVTEAIRNYVSKNEQNSATCNTTYCRSQRMLKQIDENTSYTKLAELYASENRI